MVAVHVQASHASCPHPPPCVARVHTSLLPPSTLPHPPLQVTYQLKCPTNGGYLFDFILSLDGKESKHRVVVGKGERLPLALELACCAGGHDRQGGKDAAVNAIRSQSCGSTGPATAGLRTPFGTRAYA